MKSAEAQYPVLIACSDWFPSLARWLDANPLTSALCLGLSNTCPQACVMRRTFESRWQVSNKLKQ